MPRLTRTSLGLGIQTLTEAIQLTPLAPAMAILSTSRGILQLVDAESESQERQRLAQLVLTVAVTYSELMMRLGESERESNDITRITSNLISRLEMVSDGIAAKSDKGWFTRALGRSATKKALQGCEADLQHILSILEIQIQFRNVIESEGLLAAQSESREAEREVEETISQAHEEAFNLINSEMLEQRRRKLEQSSFAHLPPAASPIFFGRSDHVANLVESLLKAPAYHAILGPGGIGKTSLALNVLHDPRIITTYGNRRYFLACETTADASGIVAGISDIFNLEEKSFMKSFRRHCENIKENMLFLFDNFETPWEKLETRSKVEELLAQLCEIPNLSIIITLRGAERPYGAQWTRPFFPIVGPLDSAASRETFVYIADVPEDDVDMATLLQEVEGVPLAITLLGTQAQYVDCASLLRHWRNFKTSIVTRESGWGSRLSSLDVSISLSVTSTRFTCNPEALHLLQILSLLPDGATVEEIVSMTPTTFDVHAAVSTVLQVALAYTSTQDRIVALAPIREHIRSKHPISQSLLESVFTYHDGLCSYAFASFMAAETPVMETRLSRCIGNVHSVLLACLKVDALSEASIKASINVSSFRRDKNLGSIALLLEESMKHADLSQKPLLHAACLMEMGHRMVFDSESHASAEDCFKAAVSFLRELPESSDLLASLLTVLTQLFFLQGRFEEGIKCGRESVTLLKESSPAVTAALAHMRLGVILLESGDFQEGAKSMDLAASCFQPEKYPILALSYSCCLSWGYTRRSMLKSAIQAAGISLNLDVIMGNGEIRRHHRAAILLSHRGSAYMFSGRYEDAINDHQESNDILISYAMESQLGLGLTYLGAACLACSDFEAASLAFQVADQIPYSTISLSLNQYMAALELCQDRIDQALQYCAMAREDVYQEGNKSFANMLLLQVQSQAHIRLGDATDALSLSVLSVVVPYKNTDRADLSRQLLVLGDAFLFIEKDIGTAKACYEAGLDLMRYLGVWRWIANALMRIGVVNHLEGESYLAVRRLNQAIGFYEKTAGMTWVGYCKERLRMINHGIVEEKVPFFPPTFQCF